MRDIPKNWKGARLRNRITVILLVLVQFGILLFSVLNTSNWSWVVRQGLWLISIFAALYVVGKPGEPTAKLSWVFVILLVPIFGGLAYLFYTFQYGSKWLRGVVEYSEETFRPLFYPDLSVLPVLEQQEHRALPLMRYLESCCGFPVYARSECTFFSPGEDFYPVLLAELAKAERYIFIETFIIEDGVMWQGVLQILEEKAAQGVNVRVLYDDAGCFMTLPRDYAQTLAQKGIHAQVFNPLRPRLAVTQNQRDHRKITSIDGKVAFTGGCNLADEYINRIEKHGHWKDAMLCVRGEAAWGLTLIGLQLWDLDATQEQIAALCPWEDMPFDAIQTDGYLQPYGDNPLGPERIGAGIYTQIIAGARDYLYINTPYLVIDDTLLQALMRASKSGVDVRIVIPAKPDHPMVQRASRSYYAQLLSAGVKLYEYTPGFMHSKVFVSDDYIAVVGTSNLDYRSLYQHFECGVVLYNCAAIAEIKADCLHTLELCKRIAPADCRRSQLGRVWQEILRLFAPLM